MSTNVDEISVENCLIFKNLVNEQFFYITDSKRIEFLNVYCQNNNYDLNMTQNNLPRNGGFLKSIDCQLRVFQNLSILDSFSAKTTIGFKLIDQFILDRYEQESYLILIENSIFFNNTLFCLNADTEYGVAIYMDTVISATIKNSLIAVTKNSLIYSYTFF